MPPPPARPQGLLIFDAQHITNCVRVISTNARILSGPSLRRASQGSSGEMRSASTGERNERRRVSPATGRPPRPPPAEGELVCVGELYGPPPTEPAAPPAIEPPPQLLSPLSPLAHPPPPQPSPQQQAPGAAPLPSIASGAGAGDGASEGASKRGSGSTTPRGYGGYLLGSRSSSGKSVLE